MLRLKNGGLEQGLLEIIKNDFPELYNEREKKRLEYLKTLPPNRVHYEKNGKKYILNTDTIETIPAPQG